MTTDHSPSTGPDDQRRDETTETAADATRYTVDLDREVCDGIFACLVRDDRFVEAADGLADIEPQPTATAPSGGTPTEATATVTARFEDDRIEDARQAARACPVNAITVKTADKPMTTEGDDD